MSDTANEFQRMYNASARALASIEKVAVALLLLPGDPASPAVADAYDEAITAICHLTGEKREAARDRMLRRGADVGAGASLAASSPTGDSPHCQVAGDPELTCQHQEAGGYRCEVLEPHSPIDCRISDHTVSHALAGNGYTCEAIDADKTPAAVPVPGREATDMDVYRSLTASPDSAAAVERLRVQMVAGDALGVREAVTGLRDFATAAQVAAVKRWLKAIAGREG